MTTVEKILLIITCTFSFLAIASLLAAIAVPGFRETGTTMTVGILTTVTTFAGIFTTIYFSKGMKQAPDIEAKKDEEEKDIRVP